MDNFGRSLFDNSVTGNVTYAAYLCHYIDILMDIIVGFDCKDTFFSRKVLFYSENILSLQQITHYY